MTSITAESVAAFSQLNLSKDFIRELRSDHAGETGAVYMYLGILWLARDTAIRAFATEHLATERKHLRFFDNWLPKTWHSVLIPLWKVAGFMLGMIATLGGRGLVFTTIKAVETFVDRHYQQQIDTLGTAGSAAEKQLLSVLISFQADEREHKDEAQQGVESPGVFMRCWEKFIATGSAIAVKAARSV